MPAVSRRGPTTTSTSTGPTTGPSPTSTTGPAADSNAAKNDALKGNVAAPTESPLAESVDPVSRASTVRTGMSGALIGDGTDVPVFGAAEGGSAAFTVKDGAPCKVLEVGAARVKVNLRVGADKKEGWVDLAKFSDQPALNTDKNNKNLMDDYEYNVIPGVHLPGDAPKGSDTAQGALADCFFVAALASITDAVPEFAKTMIRFDAKKRRYIVRFFESTGYQKFKPVEIEVDGYLPTSAAKPDDPAYAGQQGAPMWGAIVEKAYAKWKGGYDKLGGGGHAGAAMEAMTGVASGAKNTSAMKEEDVIPFFQNAKKQGQSVCCTSFQSLQADKQTPLQGSGSGPYTGTLAQSHSWNQVDPGTLWLDDKKGKVEGAWDTGKYGDASSSIEGPDTKAGKIDYKSSRVEVTFQDGKKPEKPEDLELAYKFLGVLDAGKMVVGWHVYTFQDVVGDQIQLYNPWGSWQPKPISAKDFLRMFVNCSTNQVPKQPEIPK